MPPLAVLPRWLRFQALKFKVLLVDVSVDPSPGNEADGATQNATNCRETNGDER